MKKLCKVKWVRWGLSFDDALVAQKSLDAKLWTVSYITYLCHKPALPKNASRMLHQKRGPL